MWNINVFIYNCNNSCHIKNQCFGYNNFVLHTSCIIMNIIMCIIMFIIMIIWCVHTKKSQNMQIKMAVKVAHLKVFSPHMAKSNRNFYNLFSCEKLAWLTSWLHIWYEQGFWYCFPKVILLPPHLCALEF